VIASLRSEDKQNGAYPYLTGIINFQEGDYKKAIKNFSLSLLFHEENPEAWYYQGRSWLLLGKPVPARESFRNLINHKTSAWKAKGYYAMAQADKTEKKYRAMVESLEKSIESEFNMDAYLSLVQTLVHLRENRRAEEVLKQLPPRDHHHPKAVAARAEVLLSQDKKMEAYQILKRGLGTNPNHCDLLLEFAKTNWKLGNYKNASSNSKFAIKMCPDNPDSYLYLGYVAFKIFDKKDAKKQFKKYLNMGGDENLLPKGY
jgi:tetratricopeptide (TPR) repeat protein